MAKIVVHAEDRAAAVVAMDTALAQCRIEGPASNLALHRRILRDEGFRAGAVDTAWLARFTAREPANA